MKILFFDGHCNLCNSLVDWLILRDTHDVLKFASLQGITAKSHLPVFHSSQTSFDTVVYFRDGQIYEKSTAVLYALKDIGGVWSGAQVFLIIPKRVRDAIYDLVAKNRYRLFGRKDTCRIPTPQEFKKLLP